MRIPVLLVSAAAALITLLVLRNAWRARNRSAARWRKKPMTLREKFSLPLPSLGSVLTLALVSARRSSIRSSTFTSLAVLSPKPTKSERLILFVLSVSAWGRCFHFPEVALDLTVSSHMLRRRLSFPRGGEITVRHELLLAMLRAPCGSTRAAPV